MTMTCNEHDITDWNLTVVQDAVWEAFAEPNCCQEVSE